jgi:FkbM family methyltransferase
MTSYAQNAEDVLLRRLFPPDHRGFYIDVGANDPLENSVTRYFYEQGWQGINIEPGGSFTQLVKHRPRDVNLNLGLSNVVGRKTFYDFIDYHAESTCSVAEAEAKRARGLRCVERSIAVTTLKAVCEEHVHRPIDFLSIDVEGHEREVLEGGDWERFRPVAIVVEATRPNSAIPTHHEWEDVLLAADYRFALFDGLNRFYIRGEDAHLLARLSASANLFDDFIPVNFVKQVNDLQTRLAVAEGRVPREPPRGSKFNVFIKGRQPAAAAANAAGTESMLPRRILIDCTPTFRSDCGRGVQRVVRNLVHWSRTVGQEMGIECHGVAYDRKCGFRMVDAFPNASYDGAANAPVIAGQSELESRSIRGELFKAPLRRTLSATGLLNPARRVKTAIERTLAPVQHAVAWRRRVPGVVRPGPGDILLLTDTIWDTPEVWDGVRLAVSRGAMLGAIVYDLIPLRFSELYGLHFEKVFKEWFDNVITLADFVVCISRSVCEDVQNHLGAQDALPHRATPLVGGWFRLGSGFEAPSAGGGVREQLSQLFGTDKFANPYLVVGAFDPRKDVPTVIRAFERLWASGSPARLVAIGRGVPGHQGPLEQSLRQHPQHGQKLLCFSDVEDAELEFCYRNSAALITASYAEGFNLPIVESLSRGRPVFASDIPVHREVAGAHAAYFLPRCAEALAELVLRHQRGRVPTALAGVEAFRWPDWSESTRKLFEQLVELYSAKIECVKKAA